MNEVRKILVIDDEQAEIIGSIITGGVPSVAVSLATTVPQAEKMVNESSYDLIVLDVNLPGEEGTTVAARILERDPTQPVLIVTAYNGRNILDSIERLGLPQFDKLEMAARQVEFCARVSSLLEARPGGPDPGCGQPELRSARGKPRSAITLISQIQILALLVACHGR